MTAVRDDIDFEAGTDWEDVYIWRDAALALIDTAGYTAKMQVRANVDDELPALELSTENGYITVGRINYPGTNEYNIKRSVPAAVTGEVEDFGKGVYALEITDALGKVKRLVEGFCWYSPQATRE